MKKRIQQQVGDAFLGMTELFNVDSARGQGGCKSLSRFSASQCQQQGFPGKVQCPGRTEVLVTRQVTAGHAPSSFSCSKPCVSALTSPPRQHREEPSFPQSSARPSSCSLREEV